MATSNRISGTMKAVKHEMGFGFITHDATGQDYFMHRTAFILNEGQDAATEWETLEVDDRVEFEPVEGPKGLRAIEVVRIDG